MDEQKVEAKIEETTPAAQVQTSQPEHTTPQSEETPQQIDWKRFKEARKIERQQKEEAEKRAEQKQQKAEALKAALEALVNKPGTSVTGETEETEDDRIQKKIDQALQAERQRVEKERKQREQAEFPQRLAQTYGDFDKVCSAENLDYLEYHHPEIARAFQKAPDGFDKWSDVYKAIKRYVPNNTTSGKEQKKIEKNMQRPQSMSSAGVTQTGDQAPQYLDDKKKADNWKRMQQRMRGVG
jgi:hypothetical protein